MSNQFKYVLTALTYFTRIPGIRNAPYDDAAQRQALKYFPLVGWLVGAFGALALYLGQQILPPSIAVIGALIVMLLLTGAMHEDGLADSVDGFGGGYDPENVLRIMKDSNLGVFGALALILMLALKIFLLLELVAHNVGQAMLAIMFTQACSRFVVLLIPASLDYVQLSPESKSRPMVGKRLPISSVAFSALLIALPLLLVMDSAYWLGLLLAAIGSVGLACYFKARIGGFTGDCLGATQQIAELLIYLTLLVSWTSI
jgi:adenosylcobinamide-GDP ribazoletransferase